MTLHLELYQLKHHYEFTPTIDHEPGMCISDSPAPQPAEAPPTDKQEHPVTSISNEETSELDLKETFSPEEELRTAEARKYLENRLITYRIPLEVPASTSTEINQSPSDPHPSPESAISRRQPRMTDEEKLDATLEAYVLQLRNPLLAWL